MKDEMKRWYEEKIMIIMNNVGLDNVMIVMFRETYMEGFILQNNSFGEKAL